jgi:hypothetical protein
VAPTSLTPAFTVIQDNRCLAQLQVSIAFTPSCARTKLQHIHPDCSAIARVFYCCRNPTVDIPARNHCPFRFGPPHWLAPLRLQFDHHDTRALPSSPGNHKTLSLPGLHDPHTQSKPVSRQISRTPMLPCCKTKSFRPFNLPIYSTCSSPYQLQTSSLLSSFADTFPEYVQSPPLNRPDLITQQHLVNHHPLLHLPQLTQAVQATHHSTQIMSSVKPPNHSTTVMCIFEAIARVRSLTIRFRWWQSWIALWLNQLLFLSIVCPQS